MTKNFKKEFSWMKFKEVTAQFTAPDITIAEELICNVFFSFDLKGVICNIPIEEPDEGFGTQTLPQPDQYSITGFLPLLDTSEITLKQLSHELSELSDLNIEVRIRTRIVDEKDWADAWKAYFKVTRITDKIVIKPEWQPYDSKAGEIVIHLNPGMAFGTGTHPTTAMCLAMIEKHIKPGASFLDVGTGSGILMVAASKLGAASLKGIDTDPVAVEIAGKNLAGNSISSPNELICAGIEQTDKGPYDLIAANIIAQVIVDILPHIKTRMDDDATAILSGIIKEREPDVLAAAEENSLDVIETVYTEEWVAIVVQKMKG